MTPERFAKGMLFDDYLKFIGSPENLAREGFDIRRFSLVKPRVDWSGYLRERYAKARLSDEQAGAIRWLAAQPGGPQTFCTPILAGATSFVVALIFSGGLGVDGFSSHVAPLP